MTAKPNLTPLDWTVAGLAALAEGGIDAVRVERLAKRLGTSKGSFYWHFADRAALLASLLELWEREGTADLIERAAALDDPAARLRRVSAEALETVTRGIDAARAEAALRSWAAQDPAVGLRFARVERDRVRFLAGELVRLGYDAPRAHRLGTALYLALIGLFATRSYAPDLADGEALLDMLDTMIAAAPATPRP